jgi:hypothetical protein
LVYLVGPRFVPSWWATVVFPQIKLLETLRERGLADHEEER